jgi:hypothetical protein
MSSKRDVGSPRLGACTYTDQRDLSSETRRGLARALAPYAEARQGAATEPDPAQCSLNQALNSLLRSEEISLFWRRQQRRQVDPRFLNWCRFKSADGVTLRELIRCKASVWRLTGHLEVLGGRNEPLRAFLLPSPDFEDLAAYRIYFGNADSPRITEWTPPDRWLCTIRNP